MRLIQKIRRIISSPRAGLGLALIQIATVVGMPNRHVVDGSMITPSTMNLQTRIVIAA